MNLKPGAFGKNHKEKRFSGGGGVNGKRISKLT